MREDDCRYVGSVGNRGRGEERELGRVEAAKGDELRQGATVPRLPTTWSRSEGNYGLESASLSLSLSLCVLLLLARSFCLGYLYYF